MRYEPVAIDGPAASGKSTVGRLVARALSRAFLDTGLLYRYVAWCMLRELGRDLRAEDVRSGELILKCVQRLRENARKLLEPDEKLLKALMSTEVSRASSVVATWPEVRKELNRIQRELASRYPMVVVGRDSTSEVFKDSRFRFFLDASLEERARRRYRQLKERGFEVSFEEIFEELRDRNTRDRTRELAPLRVDENVRVINTDNLSPEEVATLIVEEVKRESLEEVRGDKRIL